MRYLLLPAKDEAENLPSLLQRAKEFGYRVVVCDDGSTDGTGEVARAHGATVLTHPQNLGLSMALRTLLNWAADHLEDEDWAVFMDADGTMDPKDALSLEGRKFDLAVGSRYRGKVTGLSPWRRLLSAGASLLYRLLFPIPGVTDYTSGYRVYRGKFLKDYRLFYPRWFSQEGFTASTELLLRGRALGFQITEFPISIRYEAKRGPSKMRVLKTIGLHLALIRRMRFPTVPRTPRPSSPQEPAGKGKE